MRFNPEFYDLEVDREFRRFFGWTGEQTWRNKIAKIEQSEQFSPADAYRGYLRQKNPLRVTIDHYFKLSRDGKTVVKHLADSEKQACAYLKLLNALAHKAPESLLNRLKGSVLDEDSVKGFLFELDLAI